MGNDGIQTIDKRTAVKSDVIETHNAQQIKEEPTKMGLGDILDEMLAIPHGVYQNQVFTKRRNALKDELNRRGELLAKLGTKGKK